MTSTVNDLLVLASALICGAMMATLCRVLYDIARWLDLRRAKRLAQVDEHVGEVKAWRDPALSTLVRIVNGRPVTPPRLPVPASPWLRPAAPRRLLAWDGPTPTYVQPVLLEVGR